MICMHFFYWNGRITQVLCLKRQAKLCLLPLSPMAGYRFRDEGVWTKVCGLHPRQSMDHPQLLYTNVQRFRGGLVFEAHGLLYHSNPALRVIKKKKKDHLPSGWERVSRDNRLRALRAREKESEREREREAGILLVFLAYRPPLDPWRSRYQTLHFSPISEFPTELPTRTCRLDVWRFWPSEEEGGVEPETRDLRLVI